VTPGNASKTLLNDAKQDGQQSAISAQPDGSESQQNVSPVAQVVGLTEYLSVIVELPLAPAVARVFRRPWIERQTKSCKATSLRIVVPAVKPGMRNDPVRLKRLVLAVNAVALVSQSAWIRPLKMFLKVAFWSVVGNAAIQIVGVVSALRLNGLLLLVETVVRLDLRLLRVRLSARLVVVVHALTLVRLVLSDVNVPRMLLKLKRLPLMTIGRVALVVVRRLRRTLGLMLLSVKIDPVLIRVM
jgi:hypothetical protein